MSLAFTERQGTLKMLHTSPANIRFVVVVLHGAQSAPLDDLHGAKSIAYSPIHADMLNYIDSLHGMIVLPNSHEVNGTQKWRMADAMEVHGIINEASQWGKVILMGGSSGAMMAHAIGVDGNSNLVGVTMVDGVSSDQVVEDWTGLPNVFVLGDQALNLDVPETTVWNGPNPLTVNAYDDSLLPYDLKMKCATSIQRLTHGINLTTIGDHDGTAWTEAKDEINFYIQSIVLNEL